MLAVVAAEVDAAPTEPLAPRLELVRNLKKANKDAAKDKQISNDEIEKFSDLCEDRTNPFDECKAEYDKYMQKFGAGDAAEEQFLGKLGDE